MVVKMRYDFFFFLVAFIFWFAVETLATALVLPCVSRRERERDGRGRYWSVYQFNPLSPLSLHYLFLAPSFCLLPYSRQQPPSLPSPPPPSSAFILPLSLSISLFFLFLPLSRMFRFKYVSVSLSPPPPLSNGVDGVATPVNVTRRSIRVVRWKRRKSFVVSWGGLTGGGGFISNCKKKKIRILFIKNEKCLCWQWKWD